MQQKKYSWCTIFFFLISLSSIAQQKSDTTNADSTKHLNEVIIRGYLSERPLLNLPASVGVLSAQQIGLQPTNSLVSAMNTIPGVRMEERSPGSYRLAIRGSLIRSPFGVRDVKIYFDEIPLTDASGNTYLNAIDVNSVQGVEVLKGPDGSIFGANSGGIMLINPVNKGIKGNLITAGLNGGSYGLIHQNISLQNTSNKNQLNVNESYQNYKGYRDNSTMQRHYLQVIDQYKYTPSSKIKAIAFFSDLTYQTPGALTLGQQEANPRDARLPTATKPGAVALKTAVYSKILFGGLVNEANLTKRLHNVFTVFGTYVNFTNPSFTTYEQRNEGTIGIRTYFEYSAIPTKTITWKVNAGGEWQQTNSVISNYGNKQGVMDTTQTKDYIHTNQNFVFTRFEANIYKRWELEAALSLNNYQYQFLNVYPLVQSLFNKRPFDVQLMPRVAVSYQIDYDFIWRASISRGYSTPTTGEIRGTDHNINPLLQAQDGWNYETGFRLRSKNERFLLDVSTFYYRLNNAIVPLTHPDGSIFYLNAGGTNQPGIELFFTGWLVKQKTAGFIHGLQLNESFTYSQFKFRNYSNSTQNYSGNDLTGVPKISAVTSIYILFQKGYYFFTQYNYTDKAPLNDANTVYSSSYHLVNAKVGWRHPFMGKTVIELYAGADNLLNQQYSLGNDINVALTPKVGYRYYNPAALRNYYGGMNIRF